jgi:CO dehydrogenase maturation factor
MEKNPDFQFKKNPNSEKQKPLTRKRMLVCGKGGSGKSSVVALMADVLNEKGYRIVVLDGDASNPGGLARLMFGLRIGPKPLIEFFGGREKVECPVDNPAPLTRQSDTIPITEKNMDLNEIPSEYFIRKEGMILFQTGKIQKACEGCDGPMSKVTRDFVVKGEHVTLIDVEAGIEHFGRGVERNVDIVLVVVDPTFESLLIAEKVPDLCRQMGKARVWTILNKFQSGEMESMMMGDLRKKKINILGTIRYDPEILKAGLKGATLGKPKALEDVIRIIERLEEIVFKLWKEDQR